MILALMCMSFVIALVTAPNPRCHQTPVYGDCKGYTTIWAYSPYQKKCLQYDYSGCGGNDNRFKSFSECQAACYELDPKESAN